MVDIKFVDSVPDSRPATKDDGHLREVAAALRANAGKWGVVAKQVRSPELWFGLRDLECEVVVRTDGTLPALRDTSRTIVARTVYARYVKGYRWTPRHKAA